MIDIFFNLSMSIYVIALLSMIFVFHSIEKKKIIDELKEDNSFLQHKVELVDSLIFDTTQHALDMAARLAIYEETVREFEENKHKVTVTMYHPVPEQTDDTPNITADGTVIKVNNASDYRYVAVSRNMLVNYGGFLAYGDYVFVDAGIKSGVYQVRDTMARRWMNRIDILETPGVKPYKYKEASIRRITMASADVNDRSFKTY